MAEPSTTEGTDNQGAATTTTTDQTTSTDNQTTTTDGANLDTSTTTTTTDTDKGGDGGGSATVHDPDLDEWAKKTNRPAPTTDRERDLYQEIRNGQREFTRTKQAKDVTQDVDKAVQTAKPVDNKQDDDDERDPVEKRQDAIEDQLREERTLRVRSEYFAENSVSADEGKVMGEILQEKVDKAATPAAKKAAFDYWTNPDNIEDWHSLAKARLANTQDTTVLQQEAARKERERIAKESQSTGGTRNATTTTTKDKSGYNRTEFLKSDD